MWKFINKKEGVLIEGMNRLYYCNLSKDQDQKEVEEKFKECGSITFFSFGEGSGYVVRRKKHKNWKKIEISHKKNFWKKRNKNKREKEWNERDRNNFEIFMNLWEMNQSHLFIGIRATIGGRRGNQKIQRVNTITDLEDSNSERTWCQLNHPESQ